MQEPGTLLEGNYRIETVCGKGGMSVVYKARCEESGRIVALKEIRKEEEQKGLPPDVLLAAETGFLRKLDHPGLPKIREVLDREDSLLIVMDFVEGSSLKSLLEESGAQSEQTVIGWALQLADVLGYLHSRSPMIVYRDLKPSNIMLRPDGQLVLLDFGTAREYKKGNTEDTSCLGTRGYAAPEQYGGMGQTDARTDIYCLGATMYHLLTGQRPGESTGEVLPVRCLSPDISAGLEFIVSKCMKKNPSDRYASCAELIVDLEHPALAEHVWRGNQRSKLRKFCFSILLSACFLAAGLYCRRLAAEAAEQAYDTFLVEALEAADKDTELRYLHSAINLFPAREEAWLLLLSEGYLDDGVLSTSEREDLRAVQNEYGNGKETNLCVLERENAEGYEQFCYEAGLACFFRMESENNKKAAKTYLAVAMDAESLSEKQRERAARLYKIASYYSRIGVVDPAGDDTVTYRDYWEDMRALCEDNLVEEDNAGNAIVMYQELAALILSHAADLKEAGVSQEELEETAALLLEHLETDFSGLSRNELAAIQEALDTLEETIAEAKRVIASAFAA